MMKTSRLVRDIAGLSRRDFLSFLSIAGGALTGTWLLSACGSQLEMPPTATASASTEPTERPVELPTFTRIPTETPEPGASPTETLPPAPPDEYLPPVAVRQTIPLPSPRTDGGLPLMQALHQRHSTRSFKPDELPLQVLADLLWAAFGVNRPQTGGRTAPSAYDVRDIDVYLASAGGLYLYEAGEHALVALLPDDLRPFTGTQAFVAQAPVDLIYVSDDRRMVLPGASISADDRVHFAWAHCGFIAQNVYLFCASEGLAVVVRSTIDRQELARRMGLDGNQHIILSQTLGYPL